MRVNNSIKNSFFSLISNLVLIGANFVGQSFFIKFLGTEYLGLNSLFTNIISMLSIIDLGIGSAIIYNLYKPLANKDYKVVNSLMQFYKKAYFLIALLIAGIGLIIMPFLPFFIEKHTLSISINLVYILFIIDTFCSYLLSYKRSILYADQKNYYINIIHIFSIIILNVVQIVIFYLTRDYYLYLIIKILMHIIENMIIYIIVNKKYKFLLDRAETLDKDIENDIFKKVKALFLHKIGGFLVSCTDNMIISKFLGLVTVGLYNNYYLIINSVSILFSQALNAITSSIGNLLVEENKNKNYEVFKKIRFMNFWISVITSTAILLIMEPFIKLWLGEAYLLSTIVLVVLVFNYFQRMMRNTYSIFKEAAGIFYEDRYVTLIESAINIIASIILIKFIGLPGVFLGTLLSSLVLWCYSYPKYIYKKLFNGTYKNYVKETCSYVIIFIIILLSTYSVSVLINFNNLILQIIILSLLVMLIPNLFMIVIFRKSDNFKYYINLLQLLLNRNKGGKYEKKYIK